MRDKDRKGDGEDDKDSKESSSTKDGKRKPSFTKRLRNSLRRPACIGGGRKSPENGAMEEEGTPAGPSHGKPGFGFGNEHLPLMSRTHSKHGDSHYGAGEDHDHEKMLDDLLGGSSEYVIGDVEDDNEEIFFPDEKNKTIVALIILVFCFILNTVSLVLTHERMQKREPLPDTFLDNVPAVDSALYVGEVFIMVATFSTVVLMTLHRFRWIVYRRCFSILSLLYLLRSVTMYVTVIPVASYTYYCDPKINSSLSKMDQAMEGSFRVLKLISGFGLSINGRHTFCGDYIYSGHTVILVMAYLLIQEYAPRGNWRWTIINWTYWLISSTGVILVMVARGHYTVDVLIAYYVTTRVFWIYHTLSSRQDLKMVSDTNFLSRIWWFQYFLWLEGNVKGVLPRQYSLPFSHAFIQFNEDD